MAFLRVEVLIWADLLATYVMWIMQKYLTDVWKLGFTHAAGIMNLANGLTKVLPLLFYYFVDAGLGNKLMLLLSSLSYVAGLGFLSMSTPPVLAKATKTCNKYGPQCIGHTQKALFYAGLALMAVGISGHVVSLVALFVDQFEKKLDNTKDQQQVPPKFDKMEILRKVLSMQEKNGRGGKNKGGELDLPEYRVPSPPAPTTNLKRSNPEDSQEIDLLSLQFEPVEAILALVTSKQQKVFRSCLIVLVPVIAIFAFPYVKPWSIRFGVPAVCTSVATIAFLLGYRGCKEEDISEESSPVTNVFKVILAATLKMFLTLPNTSELYEDNTRDAKKLAHTNGLRCLDKAAIDEGQRRKWLRCTVTQVEQTKIIIHMIPISISLILCGVVSSMGSTYFVEQSKHMNYYLGKWKLPDSLLLILYASGKVFVTRVYTDIAVTIGKRHAPRIGIALATISATLCCVVAAGVETRRIQVIKDHGLIGKPDSKIPLSVFILLPQYLLLAGLDGFYEKSVTHFLSDQSPPSMLKYLVFLNPGLSGLGVSGSVLWVFVVGRVKPNWFRHDLNASRLDRYYWTLAVLSAANFVWFLACGIFYPYREITSNADDAERGEIESGKEEGFEDPVAQLIGDTIVANTTGNDQSNN